MSFLYRLAAPALLLTLCCFQGSCEAQAGARSEGECVHTSSKSQCAVPIEDQGVRQGHHDTSADEAIFIQRSVKNEVVSHAEPSSVAESNVTAKKEQHLLSQHLLLQEARASRIESFLQNRTEAWLQALAASKADPGLDEWDTSDTVMVVCMLFALGVFDWFVNPRIAHNSSHHVITLVFMLLASFIFGVFVWRQRGQSDGVAWLTGFVVEWALSMDNLFVFHLVFKAFSVPNDQSTRALGIGIYGAILFRIVFIVGLSELFTLHYAVDIVIGGLLITSGICSLSDSDDEEVHDLATVKFFKWLFGSRLQDNYNKEGRLFTRDAGGELQVTVLFLVVCIISVVDCVFAVDSVGSKTGQIKNIYINLTSSLMAMFSLRSLFFIIRDLADYFDYVKYGICAILCFVGLEMMCQHWIHVPLAYMCLIITLLFSASLVASVLKVHTFAHLMDAGGKHSGDDKHEETSEDQLETRIASVLQPRRICQEVAPSQTSGQADDRSKEVKV